MSELQIETSPSGFLFVGGPADGMRRQQNLNAPSVKIECHTTPHGPTRGNRFAIRSREIVYEVYEPSRWHTGTNRQFIVFKPQKDSSEEVLRALINRYPQPKQLTVDIDFVREALDVLIETSARMHRFGAEEILERTAKLKERLYLMDRDYRFTHRE
jgi:hypothetical protein